MTTGLSPIKHPGNLTEPLLEQLATQHRKAGSAPVPLRADVCIENVDAVTWLGAQPSGSRGYWSDRDGDFELAGVGRADVFTGVAHTDYLELMERLHARLARAAPGTRYFGGMRFMEHAGHSGEWDEFKSYRFILPRFELVRREGETCFAVNMMSNESVDGVKQEFAELVFPSATGTWSAPTPVSRQDAPGKPGWTAAVNSVLHAIETADCEKVVLARRVTYEFETRLNSANLLALLRANTHDRFHFCFQPTANSAFVGASPERLYRRDGLRLRTEAIAGTRSRGRTQEEDADLKEQLLTSAKERHEQRLVVDGIYRVLQPLCAKVSYDAQPSILELSRGQHLVSRFEAKLHDEVKDGELLARLHPTPAVGGVPTRRALEMIARCEPFDRGWYAGPVGWMTADAAQFVVGIRSGLLTGNTLHVYSGAGIVEGSEVEEEWNELENKISDFESILGET